jgi:hypothetical protein
MRNDLLSNVISIEEARLPAESPREYLGPAEVTGIAGGEVDVEVPGSGLRRARLALAFPYRPAVGDSLLVIGRGDRHYVIGVLSGSGQTVLSFPGGVDLEAGGALRLTGREGVQITGPEVGIDAGKLRVYAESMVQKVTSLYQRVSALWSVRARDVETVVDETSLTRAKSASILTEETMSINGKQIHLG